MKRKSAKGKRSAFTFRVGCLGYFNYVRANDGSLEVVAVEVPTWEHAYGLWVKGEHFDEHFDLRRHDVSITLPSTPVRVIEPPLVGGEPAQGQWRNFNLIPKFSDMCSGATLARDWDRRPSVLNCVCLTGGRVEGIPCSYSTEQVWGWGKGPAQFWEQPITHLMLFTAAVQEPVKLVMEPRTGGDPIPVTIDGPNGTETPEVMLTGSPVGFPEIASARQADQLDFGHLLASLSLCNVDSGGITWHSKGARPRKPTNKPDKAMPCDIGPPHVRRPTKVDCGPRVFEEAPLARARSTRGRRKASR